MKSELKTLLAVMLMTIMCVVAATIGYMLPHNAKVEVPKAVTDEISALKTSLAEAGERLKSADTNHAVAQRSLESELKSAKDYAEKLDAKLTKAQAQAQDDAAALAKAGKDVQAQLDDAKTEAIKAKAELEAGTSSRTRQLEKQIADLNAQITLMKGDFNREHMRAVDLENKLNAMIVAKDKADADAKKKPNFGPGKL